MRHLLPCLIHGWPGQHLQDARCCQLRGGNGQWRQFECADDAALIDVNTTLASARVTALVEGPWRTQPW